MKPVRQAHHTLTFLATLALLIWAIYSSVTNFELSVQFISIQLTSICSWSFFIYWYCKAQARSCEHEEGLLNPIGPYIGHYIDDDGLPRAKFLKNSDRYQHQMTGGGSGFGKTFSTLKPQIFYDIDRGDNFVVIINMKADKNFENEVYSRCVMKGRSFKSFSITQPDTSNPYNPLLFGTRHMIRDKVMCFSSWDNAFYKKIVKADISKKLKQIFDEGVTVSRLKELFLDLDDKDFKGVVADLEGLEHAPFFEKIDVSFNSIKDFYEERCVFYITLDEDSMPEYARDFARLLFNDLRGLAGYVRDNIKSEDRIDAYTYIDEAKEVLDDALITYNSRSRDARFCNIFCTQSFSGDIGFNKMDRLYGSVKSWHLLGGLDANSVEWLLKNIGTDETIKFTEQVELGMGTKKTGLGSSREANKWSVSPNLIKRLKTGEGVFFSKEDAFSKKLYYDAMFYLEQAETLDYHEDFYTSGRDKEIQKKMRIHSAVPYISKPSIEDVPYYVEKEVIEVNNSSEGNMPF